MYVPYHTVRDADCPICTKKHLYNVRMQLNMAERSITALKGVITKLKNRMKIYV